MGYRVAADVVLVLHAAFILFVIAGSLVAAWRPRLAWLHLAAVLWGAGVMLTGAICPLTPFENSLRHAAGQVGYEGGFIEHYIVALIYPSGLTRPVQVALGACVLLGNVGVYLALLWRWRRRSSRQTRTVQT